MVLLGCCLLVGCTINKEPLRSGWLVDGVYPQPPPPACTPVDPPGRSYGELSQWPTLPSGDVQVNVQINIPFFGPAVAISHAAGSTGPRFAVSSRAPRAIRVLDDRTARLQVPGFLSGVDLRPYRRIAFIADTSAHMCNDYQACPESAWKFGPPAPALKAMGDQIDAAAAGLPADQVFFVIAGDASRTMRYAAITPTGRSLAGQFVRGQICSGQRGVRGLFARALDDAPDVIVLLTDGYPLSRADNEYEDKYGGCGGYPNSLICAVNETTEQVDVAQLASGGSTTWPPSSRPLPPIITITVKRHGAVWLHNLAEATGGAYIDAAP